MMSAFHIVYLTGPPAVGKSTLLAALEQATQPLRTFSYSEELAHQVSRRVGCTFSQDDMRRQSARVIEPADVAAVDEALVNLAADLRGRSHLVIDSHAVTKEEYGFRVTAFTMQQLVRLAPTRIFVLYTDPTLVIDRIQKDPRGRPPVTPFEASFHLELQAGVALIYGLQLGIPVYFLDASKPTEELVSAVASRISRP